MMTVQVRPGFQTVSPYLTVHNAQDLLAFLSAAFDAQHTYTSPKGTHVEVRIGDSMVMIGEVPPDQSPTTGQLFLYVSDPDEHFRRALAAGATSVLDPMIKNWGQDEAEVRGAGIRDLCGNTWFLAGPPLMPSP